MKGDAQRVGAIDVGSNSVKLLVADIDAGGLREVERWGRVTRLARGVDAGGVIGSAAQRASRAAIAACASRARELRVQRLVAGATGALRQARNGAHVASQLGEDLVDELPILTPAIEAALSLVGVRAGAAWLLPLVTVDIGGSTTELTTLNPGGVEARSLPVGAVGLTERFLGSDPPRAEEWDRLDAYLGSVLGDTAPAQERPFLGVGGTISALAMMTHGIDVAADTHGTRLTIDAAATAFAALAPLTTHERHRRFGISLDRADIVAAGARILLQLMQRLVVQEIRVSAWGLRHGLALASCSQGPDPRLDRAEALRLASWTGQEPWWTEC
jgi:exopolyphosphatase/guanosine-5'-triphosphate,3'-diphosphate pyrophosphatase